MPDDRRLCQANNLLARHHARRGENHLARTRYDLAGDASDMRPGARLPNLDAAPLAKLSHRPASASYAVSRPSSALAERYTREQEELAKAGNQLKAQQQKIDSLEQRVQVAEQTAQQAEQAAQQQPTYSAFYGTEYPAYYYPYPQNRVVIVNSDGSTTVIPSNSRPVYQRSGIQVNGSFGNVNVRYSSGGSYYNNWAYPRNSTIIVRTQQPQPPAPPPAP